MIPIENIVLYRITHIENIPHTLKHGITHKLSPNANDNYINIGDTSLISTRTDKTIYIDNGLLVNPFQIESIVLGDFIPFYFGVRMPMLYTIQNGGNFVETPTPAEDIIYIAISLQSIIASGSVFYFTDGHATNNFTSFYNKDKVSQLSDIIDWDAVKASYWGGDENLNVKRKKQAECLVKDDINPNAIVGFGCFSESSKAKLLSCGIAEKSIKIIPKAYF